MQKKPARPTRKRKNESRGIPISDAGLDEFEGTVKKAAETNSEVRERLPLFLRYLAMIREHIRENDARRAVYSTIFLVQLSYEAGLDKPFAPRLKARMASSKGGSADKRKKGILAAVREILPRLGKVSPASGWRFFQRNHSGSLNQFAVKDSEYELYYDRENNLLVQVDGKGKESSMPFKTFQNYFYSALREGPETRR